MSEKMIADNAWGQIIWYDEWSSLELRWLASTARAADPELRSTMETFAREAADRKPKTLIVDNTEFHGAFGDGMMEWRRDHIIPLYNQSGAAKFAFIVGEQYPRPTAESGATPAPEGGAKFPTGWFKSREAAYRWLATA